MSGPAPDKRDLRPGSAGLAVMLRALFVYLLLVWIMLRVASVDQHGNAHLALIAGAILVGFPITAGMARLLHRRPPAALTGGWRISLAAVATALILPVTCLQMTGRTDRPESVVSAADHQIVPAALVHQLTDMEEYDGLRLRIRGLSVTDPGTPPGVDRTGPVMLLLDTTLRDSGVGRRVLIEVRLIEEAGERILWRDEYVGDPADTPGLRRLLIRALTEGMSRTREGIAEGRLI